MRKESVVFSASENGNRPRPILRAREIAKSASGSTFPPVGLRGGRRGRPHLFSAGLLGNGRPHVF